MPTLTWIGKEKVVNHHQEVPYRVLEHKYGFRADDSADMTPTNSGNKIIHGDNLEALKSLLPKYEGRIKCIYIDPPYNTGNEKWIYNDNVNDPKIKKWLGAVAGKQGEDLSRHDKWLCMMYPRLRLLHKLLSDDGIILISIDDNELINLQFICGEIFGVNNHVNTFIWYTEGHTDNQDVITHVHEYILCYAKNISQIHLQNIVDPNIPLDSKILRNFAENSITKNGEKNPPSIVTLPQGFPCESDDLNLPPSNDITTFYEATKDSFISRQITKQYGMSYPARLDAMVVKNGILTKECRVYTGWMNLNKLKNFIDNGCIPIQEESGTTLQFYLSKNGVIYYRREGRVSRYIQSVLQNMGTTEKNKYLLEAMGVKFDYPKPVELIDYLISIFTGKQDIILDSFAGSGTTAHAVLNLNKDGGNRKFILVEMEDSAENITAERVRRVMNGYGEGKNAVVGTGGAFDYYELGAPMFDQEKNLNEEVDEEKIREYIYYTETKRHLDRKRTEEAKYLLDTYNGTGYYFYYEKDCLTMLSIDTLGIVTERAEQYVIYADICTVPPQVLAARNITFKKIPRDIKRF